MYAIADKETGRYLSVRSVPEDEKGRTLYVTYSGKLGTDFYTTIFEAEMTLNILLERLRQTDVIKLLQIITVNPDQLCLGKQFSEILSALSIFAVL